MTTLRLTVIFALLALILIAVVTMLYSAFKPTGLAEGPVPSDPIQTIIIPIACGLIAAPFTLRINRWLGRRMSAMQKSKP